MSIFLDYTRLRIKMVEGQLVPRGISDERVLAAMRKVPRHLFVDEALHSRAYDDNSLPIGEGQTISQPFMVAVMTQLLALKGKEKVLEIGTGSGYQAAVLAELCDKVYSIERIKALGMRARKLMDELGYCNVAIKILDGTYGWSEEAPFDAIIVTAGGPDVPQSLVDQLAVGGRLVMPVGGRGSQVLTILEKTGQGIKKTESIGCVFVPLIGTFGWKEP